MSYRVVVPLCALTWLLLALASAESEQISWFISTLAPEEPSTFGTDDNELSSATEPTTVPAAADVEDLTTTEGDVATIVYVPGTKLLAGNKPKPQKVPDAFSNQVSDTGSGYNTLKEGSGVVVNSVSVRSDIKFRYAKTVVYSKIGNAANSSNQATFSVLLPETAFISKFFIEVGGKKYEAYVKRKEEAEKEYQDALESGFTAAHVAASTQESNVFEVSVNVAPRSKVAFNLTYEELLSRRLSAYHHTINLLPKQDVQDLNIDVYIRDVRNITLLNVTTTDEGKQLQSGGDDLLVEYLSSHSAHVHFSPKEEDATRTESKLQQLNVMYDVDRKNPSGDILLRDGYFVHYFAPEDVPPAPKHIIFVLDTSGSMWGRKLQQVQQAMCSILDNLRDSDYFSIVQFSTNVLEWSTQPQEMVGLSKYKVTHPVNEMNIAKAKQFIKSMEASGGTNISGALRKALQLAAKQDYGTNNVEEAGEKRDLPQDMPQPIMIFLTDGIATVGELYTGKILAQVRAVNTEIRVALFSLAFGDGANYRFLKKLSLQNDGFARKIYESSDAALQLKSFFNEIASPMLANVTFTYIDNKVDKNTLTAQLFHSYYGGSEIIVAGKLTDSSEDGGEEEDLGAEVYAWSGGEHREVQYKPDYNLEKARRKKNEHQPGTMERLWAYLTIRQLLDEHLASTDEDKEVNRPTALVEEKQTQSERVNPKQKALELSLQYGFVTPLTSLVVVVPKNGSRHQIKEIIKAPLGNSLLESASFHESSPMQNKIMPIPFLPRPPALTVKPTATQSSSVTGTTTASTTSTATFPDEEEVLDLIDLPAITNYTLGDITWLMVYLDSEDRLVVEANENSTSKNSTYLVSGLVLPKEVPSITNACITPEGDSGSCRVMSTCVQSSFVDDYETFLDFFCPIGRLAGVCCPNKSHSTGNDSSITTTDIPETLA